MRSATLWVVVASFAMCSSATASTGPMDDKDLAELATLIVHGEVTEVVCAGSPEFDGTKTYTPYQATLVIDDVQKGEAADSVTLPFATLDYEPDASLPKCDWVPYYEVGYRGLFYLTTGASTDLYTLVGDGAYVPDADSVGLGLPSCQLPDNDAVDSGDATWPDADIFEEDSAEVGPVSDSTGDAGTAEEPAPSDAVEGASLDAAEGADTSDEAALDVSALDDGAWPCLADESCECVTDKDCDDDLCFRGACEPQYVPHRPDCDSDDDCAEGEECVGNSNGDAFCEAPCTSDDDCSPGDVCVIDAWGNGYCEWGGPESGGAAEDAPSSTTSSGADEGASSDDEGGCAGGSSSLPSGLVLLAGLMLARRRRFAVD